MRLSLVFRALGLPIALTAAKLATSVRYGVYTMWLRLQLCRSSCSQSPLELAGF